MKNVVITGVGVVSPLGVGAQAFTKGLRESLSGIRRIQAFDPSGLPVQIAAEVPDEQLPDSPGVERKNTSRTMLLARLASEEAFRDSGLVPDQWTLEEQRQCGVIIGSGGGNWEFTERQYLRYLEGGRRSAPSLYAVPTSTAGNLSSELSTRFGLKGMSLVLSTGCASSTDAIGYAFREVQAGRLEKCLTGGADAVITQSTMTGFCLMGVLAQEWNEQPALASRPFSRSRSGFVLGEGAWMFILEEEEAARKRGAKIYGRLLGYGATCAAYHRVRLDEGGDESVRAIQLAMREARVPLEEIGYASLHGTSTVQNDRVETQVIHRSFGAQARRLVTGAIKSMIGHPQGASGAASLAATLLAAGDGFVHPTLNLNDPDPVCDLDYVPEGPRPAQWTYALCNTLSFGSKSSALVIGRPDVA